ncbi:MAG: TlpA disulfide reductase family protein, partial [Flavobacteriaceae bacterium]|nr:TlpA disulfide reductase family protein [Flavobacteriaceae bacterium]
MKSGLRLIFVFLVIFSCKDENEAELAPIRDSYVINGTAPGVYNGVRVYLKSADTRGRLVDRDTAVIMNEAFKFEGKVATPEQVSVHVNSVNGSFPMILENEEMTLNINKEDIQSSTITGSKSNEAFQEYMAQYKNLYDQSRNLNQEYRTALQQQDSVRLNSAALELQAIGEKQSQLPLEFIKSHSENFFSLTLLDDMLKSKTYQMEDLEEAYDSLDEDLKNTTMGEQVTMALNQRREEEKRLAALSEGNKAPYFRAPNPQGEMVSLDDVKGKATIIDFWAAWCGPCRRENPNVVRVYNKYKDKGLEIIGVSLDGSSRQNDPKAAWLQA